MNDTKPSRESDRSEILDLLATYAFGLDRRDFSAVASVFTDDAVVENTFDAYMPEADSFSSLTVGGSAVADGARELFNSLDATQHLLGAQTVDLTEAGAHASTQIVAHHHRGTNFYNTGGTYEDDLIRTADGWRISGRVLRITWTNGSADIFAAA
ncbi:hypothetical protein GCM10025867_08310 [Frondihabitans sucicola]|uniref:SnoaL-like domain-containing protein n=1 Tax=Frondihabitans sucicola TaxID=1268041 RepID=A0ABM8GJM4_9MICO|nr:nuclear transport factor 2 family protein [Frondihabitans sucicola]BDZ48590.1 hypothetical protein GCM10025867_08310 [Frondihabitans sucicola]